MSRAGLLAALLLVAAAARAAPVTDEAVTATASQLRCVVCQNLSVADSPSEMARQMRDVIHERLGTGETREQVIAYFVDRYGEWVLLAPRPRGFNLVLWTLPFAGLFGGLLAVGLAARRWARRRPEMPEASGGTLPEPDRERLQAELDELRD